MAQPKQASQRKQIAVIGSGMAGLAAAWFLGERHAVTLFERQSRLGIGAHSVEAPGGVVDVPLRVIYPGYYPQLFAVLSQSGVPVEPLDASLAFSDLGGETYFRYSNLRVLGKTLPWVMPGMWQRGASRRILFDLGRLPRLSVVLFDDDIGGLVPRIGDNDPPRGARGIVEGVFVVVEIDGPKFAADIGREGVRSGAPLGACSVDADLLLSVAGADLLAGRPVGIARMYVVRDTHLPGGVARRRAAIEVQLRTGAGVGPEAGVAGGAATRCGNREGKNERRDGGSSAEHGVTLGYLRVGGGVPKSYIGPASRGRRWRPVPK